MQRSEAMTLAPIIEAVGVEPYFRDGSVVIYHGDARDILPLIPAGSVDLVLTDPPWGVGANTDSTRFTHPHQSDKWGKGRSDWGAIIGDDQPFDPRPLLAFPTAIIWGANHFALRLPVGTRLRRV